jgi:hypothetical protein
MHTYNCIGGDGGGGGGWICLHPRNTGGKKTSASLAEKGNFKLAKILWQP